MNMKRNHYIFILAAATLTLNACSNEKNVVDEEIAKVAAQEGNVMTFSATSVNGMEYLAEEDLDANQPTNAKPRTIDIDTDFRISNWYTNDRISVSDGVLNYTYSPKTDTEGSSCSFEAGGKEFTTDGTGSESTFYAFYPKEAVLGWNGPTVTTMIWTEQLYSENAVQSGVMGPYVAAKAETTGGGANASFDFGHICSVIDVDLSGFDGGEVESVALYANSQISIAGKMTYNTNTKAISVITNDATDYSWSTQSEMIRVSEVNATKPTVRFYVLPVKQAQGFTITVRTSDGKYYTKSSTNSVGNSSANADYLASVGGVSGGTVCLPYYKKYKFGSKSSARTQNWMAMVPGNVKFNHLSLPGTHDAATSACSSTSAKCQQYTIAEQLEKGCRALDLRPYYNSSSLEIYHGIASTGVTLANALEAVKTFLTANPTETVFVLIAQEGGSDGNTNWQNRVWNCLNGYTDYIASYGWQGNLNPCRGKMVVIFRNTYTGGSNNGDLGCGKVGWGSSFNDKSIMTGNGSVTVRGTLRYQDEYETTNTTTKLNNLTKMLNEHIAANETNTSYTFVNNTNIAGTLSNISNLSTSMNTAILASTTFTNHTGKFGIMMVDFLHSTTQKGDQMFEMIHKQNYKYVYLKRTRKVSESSADTGANIAGDEYADETEVYSKKR